MATKHSILVGLGDSYAGTGYARLPFIYKNIADLSGRLAVKQYQTFPAILDQTATRKVVKDYLLEKISMLQSDDWLLFYFTGHGDIRFNPASGNQVTTCLVTSFAGFDPSLGLSNFLLDDDYAEVITAFRQRAQRGHLITVLDCCYAFGLVDTFSQQADFHSIIAASSFDRKSFYDTNSIFYQAFQSLIDLNLAVLAQRLRPKMRQLYNASNCQVQVATKFMNSPL
jgi:hypothetical protein